MTYLQDDDSKGGDDHDPLHLRQGASKGHAMLVLLQHRLVVLSIAGVVRKEVVEHPQHKADDAHGQEHHPPAVNAKWTVSTCARILSITMMTMMMHVYDLTMVI